MYRLIFSLLVLNFCGVAFSNLSPSALAVMHTEEFLGTITSMKFGDPLQAPYFDIAQIKVIDFGGKNLTFQINTGTLIRDPFWHEAHVAYLQKGMKVKVHYVSKQTEPFEAIKVYVVQEKDEDTP